MPNRYAGMYDDYIQKLKSAVNQNDQQMQNDQNKANGYDSWATLAEGALPVLGAVGGGIVGGLAGAPAGGVSAIPGAVAGMTAGGSIGNMAGQALGQGLHNMGQSQMDPDVRREMERQALMAAIMQAPRM